MTAARDEILRRVRAALDGAPAPPPVERRYRRDGSLDRAALAALFSERLLDYRARVERTTASGVGAAVAAAVGEARVVVPPGLPAAWRPPHAVDDDGLTPLELDGLDGAVTGCTVAIAETGTLVLAAGPAEGRRAITLVPDLHVCIVRGDQIVATVPEALGRLAGLERRPLTFVSGPSATSDIELSRVEGVHGPRRLVAIVVEEAP